MSLSVQLLHREDFESRTLRGLAGAAGMGLLAALVLRLRIPLEPGYFAVAAAALAGAKPSVGQGWGLRAALAVLPIFPFFFDAPREAQQSLAGAIAGGLVAWMGRGREGAGTPTQWATTALAAAALTPLGGYVGQVLDARFIPGAPGVMSTLTNFLTMGLFWCVGTLPLHLAFHTDKVAARGGTLADSLRGEARELALRASALYAQCKASASKMPPSAGRTELLTVLTKMAEEAYSLAEAHAGLEAQLDSVVPNDVDAQVRELRQRAQTLQDPVARRQLELAASSLGEELNHLDALARRRERLLAQLHAQVALLERARVSFIGAQGSEMDAKGAQAAQLARRLKALGEESTAAPPPVTVDDEATPVPRVPQGSRTVQ